MSDQSILIHPKLDRYAALVGLDWAHGEHVYSLLLRDGAPPRSGRVANAPAALRAWLEELREECGGGPVALCVEHNRCMLMRELAACEWIDVFAVNPATAAKYRRMFAPSGDKSDLRDSDMMLDLLATHPDRLRALPRREPEALLLNELCRARRKAVDGRTRRVEALVDLLRSHYPLAMEMVGEDLSRPLALAFLRRWSSHGELIRARPQTLRSFFHAQRCRSLGRVERRLEALEAAPREEAPDPLAEVFALRLRELVEAIAAANKTVAAYDKAIREQCRKDRRAAFFESLPGAGEAMAPRLLAAFRMVDPLDAQQMNVESGVAPIREQSGNSTRVCMRRHCSKFLRQTLHEYAGCSVRYSSWARAFYIHAVQARGMGPQAAKRALAFKWGRVLTACWKSGQAYDERRYIESLRRKDAPCLKHLESAA